MKVLKDVSLTRYSTMHLGGKTSNLVEIESKEDLVEAVTWAKDNDLNILMIGNGSNIVWKDSGFNGLIIVNNIKGFSVIQNGENFEVTIGAGEEWDEAVEICVDLGLSGIEALSLIPGKTGGTPVQNVGAYGQELSNTLIDLEAFDLLSNTFITITNAECGFSYRKSRFNSEDKNKFLITSIRLSLKKTSMSPPFYSSLDKYLGDNNITDFSPKNIRQAVISIRSAKLPDPKVVNNVGSFFANPIINEEQFKSITEKYKDVPNWTENNNQIKLSAAWLIEMSGFKDFHDTETGMATWQFQPLVLVNEHARNVSDLLSFKEKIVSKVEENFGITLTQEPEMLP